MRLRTTAGLTLAALLLTSLAACTDDDSGASPSDPDSSTTTASTSPTTDPSPTATNTGPSIPADAQGKDEASAKAFVRFYFATLSKAMQTGDTEALRQLATKKCKTCSNFADLIDETYGEGGRYETEGWRVTRAVPGPSLTDGQLEFYLATVEEERQLFDADGRLVDTNRRTETGMRTIVKPRRGAWTIDGLEVLR